MFRDLAALLAVRRQLVRRAVAGAGWANWTVVSLYLVLGAFIMIGAYFFFLRAFHRLLDDPLSGGLVARYVLENAFALMLLLGVMSFVAAATRYLFRSEELTRLLAWPLDPLAVFADRFLGATALSAWPVLFIGGPALAALGASLAAPWPYYVFALAVLVLFSLAIAVIGGVLSFPVAGLARRVPAGRLWFWETLLFVSLGGWLIHRLVPRWLFGAFVVVTPADIENSWNRLHGLFASLPSHFFADFVSPILPWGPPLPAAGLWSATALVAGGLLILAILGRVAYLPICQLCQEGGFLARPQDAPLAKPRRPFPRFIKWGHGFLFEKEVLVLSRSPEDLAKAGFLLFLLFLYLMVAGAVSRLEAFERAEAFAGVVAAASGIIGYFALVLGLRFAFPSLSLEGRGAWAVWSSPEHRHELFSWKFFFWAVCLAVPSAAAAVISWLTFGLPPWLGLFLLYVSLNVALAMAAITLGQGSIFPNFRSRDPEALATSPAGLMATGLGLTYLWIMTLYVRRFTATYLTAGRIDVAQVFGVLIVTLTVVAAYWVAAPRAMEKLEIPS